MPKKILVIDDNRGRWNILHNFEHKQKKLFLKNLTVNKALKMFRYFYQFAQKVGDKEYYKNINSKKIDTLSKVHSMFMRVK